MAYLIDQIELNDISSVDSTSLDSTHGIQSSYGMHRETTLADIENKCQQYTSDNRYVFKKCRSIDKKRYIVVLEKTPETLDNEARSYVDNASYAYFRANLLMVRFIVDIDTLNANIDRIATLSWNEGKVTDYLVGQLVLPDFYDQNIENIFTHGIHYFKTLKAAYYFNLTHEEKNLTEYCVLYEADGSILQEGTYINGRPVGLWRYYTGSSDDEIVTKIW